MGTALPLLPIYWRVLWGITGRIAQHELQKWLREHEQLEGTMVVGEGLFNLVKCAMVIERTGEDVAVMDFHIAPIRDGLIADTPASQAEMDTIVTLLQSWWTEIDGFFRPEDRYARLVFHDAGPKITNEDGFTLYPDGTLKKNNPHGEPANPALRTDLFAGNAGTSASTKWMPPQIAVSITLKTTARRSWGRVYLPFGDSGHLTDSVSHAAGAGQLAAATVETIADSFVELVDALATNAVPLVVWSPTHQVARSVDQVQVDSLFDVVRSRRFDRPFVYEQRTPE